MSLRQQAAADLQALLEDTAAGFGWPITVTSPDSLSLSLSGFSTDIGQTIDPETGMAVSGRRASVALPLQPLVDASLGIPRAIADGGSKPWVVRFEDILGVRHTYKVCESMPDRALGIVTCLLESYRS